MSATAATAKEEKFATLKVGDETYQAVTVTTKAANYIYITHSAGMTSIKVSQLPADIREKLGYAVPATKPPLSDTARAWAKQGATHLNRPEIKQMQAKLQQAWQFARQQLLSVKPALIIGVAAGLLTLYLFFCYCCKMICQKTGKAPGALVWLPVLKMLPMLQAASMSRWWFVLCLIPVLNLVAYVTWCFKIVHARGKTLPLAILLLLPVGNALAFLVLAFSDGSPRNSQEPRLDVAGWQTA
jgi:hypothetical protein